MGHFNKGNWHEAFINVNGPGLQLKPKSNDITGQNSRLHLQHRLGPGLQLKPKPKAIMGKTKQSFSSSFASPPAHQPQRESSTTGGMMKRRSRDGAVNREELRRRDEEGSRGGAVKRGAVEAVWRRPEGAAAVGCRCGCVHNRSG